MHRLTRRTRVSRGTRVHGLRAAALATSLVLAVSACGDDDEDTTDTVAPAAVTTTAAPTGGASATATAAVDAPLVSLAETSLGQVLVAPNGFTLYAFDPDAAGTPTCTAACAGNWPLYVVEDGAELTAGPGLDASMLDVVEHPEGDTMLSYGGWPLYFFAGDIAPGDVNGQAVNDVWWVIGADGNPIR
jgi:predicted lipoprotein with Yx(FWY)xxD motif